MTLALLALGMLLQAAAPAPHARSADSTPSNDGGRQVAPVLFFPEPGMDDTAAYQGYATRFYRDSKSNTVQIYLDRRSGREVLLWADALERERRLHGARRTGTCSESRLGCRGRDGQRFGRHAHDHLSPSGRSAERDAGLVPARHDARRARLPVRARPSAAVLRASVHRFARIAARREHRAASGGRAARAALAAPREQRRRAAIPPHARRSPPAARAPRGPFEFERPALDGKSHLSLELIGTPRDASARVLGRTVTIRARTGRVVHLTIRVTTDGTALTPLARDEIFSPGFLSFLSQHAKATTARIAPVALEREVRSVELLSSNEKLMAGLPNYATYFGRDGMMTAFMMRSIWTPVMSERVIASVLGKLAPTGDVSHEEALGEQAIREHADEYNARMKDYFSQVRGADRARADSDLVAARGDSARAQAHARELPHDGRRVPAAGSRGALSRGLHGAGGAQAHLPARHREQRRVAPHARCCARWRSSPRKRRAFAQNPVATNLVSFVRRDSTHWQSASWRDSDVGYANGRFAMDINAIWAPRALQAIASTLSSLRALGFSSQALDSVTPEIAHSPLGAWLGDSTPLVHAIESWQRARKLFVVALGAREVERRIRAKLASLPAAERDYWEKTMAQRNVSEDSVVFLALSLDAQRRADSRGQHGSGDGSLPERSRRSRRERPRNVGRGAAGDRAVPARLSRGPLRGHTRSRRRERCVRVARGVAECSKRICTTHRAWSGAAK